MDECENSLKFVMAPAKRLSAQVVRTFVEQCVSAFPEELRVTEIDGWVKKLAEFADCFYAIDAKDDIVAALFVYLNDVRTLTGYVTLVCKLPGIVKGVAHRLHQMCIREALARGFVKLRLEVVKTNDKAIAFYDRQGYHMIQDRSDRGRWLMELELTQDEGYDA